MSARSKWFTSPLKNSHLTVTAGEAALAPTTHGWSFFDRFGYARNVMSEKGRVGFIEPMLALAVTKLPEGPAWSYELKFDGYRALALKAAGGVRLLSRNGKDFTKRFAAIAVALERLPDDTVIDCEIIA